MVFRFAKTLDPITLFHTPALPSSSRVLTILKQAATAAEAGTVDSRRGEFQLEITTAPPTSDQLRNILDYVTANPAGAGQNTKQYAIEEVVRGAKDAEDALKRFKEDPGVFVRPVTVDWTNGKAVLGDNESEILKMVHQLDVD
ncbi:hypothetical protein EYZ11_011322 [Aspergillus tanneri]|uniref:Thioredoxin-like protein n=1 Tax=Aspergillus tanneri TaxID=1220188 RepID=A0A4S3J8J5_9EURO|nr:hypothetical protein EYZ11_011322 [Aspergillus tanneri]